MNGAQLVGSDRSIGELRSRVRAIRSRPCTVLITGESGTGKELVARHIHFTGPRAGGPFVPVDCTTLRDTLLESQLFGHVKGAFTGASQSTVGLFRAADGGTLFLDEIGELRLDLQAKLLRCIQDGTVTPLGATEAVVVDVRIIAATNRDLDAMVRKGDFRKDLYYRLNVVQLQVPPLRDRENDVMVLAEHFLQHQAAAYAEPAKTLSDEARATLAAYDWPGNVRELQNAIERAFIFSEGAVITCADLPCRIREAAVTIKCNGHNGAGANGNGAIVPLEEAVRQHVRRAILATNGNQSRAASLLKIDRHRLARMVRRYDLESLTQSRSPS